MANPRFINSQRRSPEQTVMLRKYWSLQAQRSSIQRRPSNSSTTSSNDSPPSSPRSIPDLPDAEMSASESSSVECSPTMSAQPVSTTLPPFAPLSRPRRLSKRLPSIEAIPEDDVVSVPAMTRAQTMPSDEQLYQINHDIKSTLTDLLNCDQVRHDHKMRLWVQSRLMEAELELKRQRKRRISAPTIVVSPAEEVERRISL